MAVTKIFLMADSTKQWLDGRKQISEPQALQEGKLFIQNLLPDEPGVFNRYYPYLSSRLKNADETTRNTFYRFVGHSKNQVFLNILENFGVLGLNTLDPAILKPLLRIVRSLRKDSYSPLLASLSAINPQDWEIKLLQKFITSEKGKETVSKLLSSAADLCENSDGEVSFLPYLSVIKMPASELIKLYDAPIRSFTIANEIAGIARDNVPQKRGLVMLVVASSLKLLHEQNKPITLDSLTVIVKRVSDDLAKNREASIFVDYGSARGIGVKPNYLNEILSIRSPRKDQLARM